MPIPNQPIDSASVPLESRMKFEYLRLYEKKPKPGSLPGNQKERSDRKKQER